MKTKKNKVLSGPGDLPLNASKSQGLGALMIDEIVQAAGSITALLLNVFKRPPADAWSTYSDYDRNRYVEEALQISTTSVITGNSFSISNTFRKLISRVELNENWDRWQRKNPEFLPALYQADDEVKQYRTSGYKPDMQYVNPQIIARVLHPNTTKSASLIGGDSAFIMLFLSVVGGTALFMKKFIFNNKNEKNGKSKNNR